MKRLNLDRTKIIGACDKVSFFSLCAVAYFLPISKALIESFTGLAIACFLIKKFCQFQDAPRTNFDTAVFIYLIVCFVSVFISTNFFVSLKNFIGKAIENVLFFFVLIDILNKERRVKIFLYVFFISSLLLGVDGVYQYFTHKDFIRNRPYAGLPRIHTTFPTPNDFGCYLYSVMPFTLVFFFGRIPEAKILRMSIAALFILLFTCLIMTVSRGAWFAFIVSVIFMSAWIRPLLFFLLAAGLFLLVTHNFFEPLLRERLKNPFMFSDTSSQDRKLIWHAAWKMIVWRPWLGLGLGTFMFNFDRFVAKGYIFDAPYAHNCYLQIAAELGMVGLLVFLAIIIIFFWQGIRLLNSRQRSFFWYILLASLGAMAGYCFQMGMDTIFYSLDLGLLFWILLGLGTVAMNVLKSEHPCCIGETSAA